MLTRLKQIPAVIKQTFASLEPVFTRENMPNIVVSTFASAASMTANFLTFYLLNQTVIALSSDDQSADLAGADMSAQALAGLLGVSWTVSRTLANYRGLKLAAMAPNTGRLTSARLMDHIFGLSLSYHNSMPQGSLLALVIKCYMSAPNLSSGFMM